jgi:ketosteroid isomerase-like protein
MKIQIVAIFSFCLLANGVIFAQTKAEMQLKNSVELLRKAMVDVDKTVLNRLTDNELSYGHSGGKIEDKAAFINALVSGESDFVTIELTDQTIEIVGKTAIVRHNLAATTNNGGKAAAVKLHVLNIWQKQNGSWRLLARQAVKI